MTTATDERQTLSDLADHLGWQRNEYDRVDVFIRGLFHVHVVWQGSSAINGGSHYDDSGLLSYTRDLAKIQSWLAK
jgi:hypothetical protein